MPFPPGFVKSAPYKGLNPPHCQCCNNCVNHAGTGKLLCWKYGAYVFLDSSCASFEQNLSAGVTSREIEAKFRSGVDDLTK